MSTTVEEISSTKKRLKIEIPVDIIEREYKDSLNKLQQKAKIPGFRPGKTPINLIEKKFGSDIKAEIIDKLVPEYYSKALKENDLMPVTMPDIESALDIKRNEPLSFSLTVEVMPKISNLNYTGLKVDDVEVNIEDKEVDEMLKSLQEERALFEVVDRPIKEDDLIVIDYVQHDVSGEKELSSGKDKVMNLGNKMAPQGILEEITGKRKGDVVEISLPVFEGQEVKEGNDKGNRLRITIKEVKEKKLVEIDNEFAKDFSHETLDSLKGKIREKILQAKKENAANGQKERLLEMLVAAHDLDIPESLLEKELETLVVNEKHSSKKSKELIDETEASAQKTEDPDMAARLKPKAINNVKASILLDMIAVKEEIKVTEEELKSKINLLAQQLQSTPESVVNLFVTKDGSLEKFKNTIKDEKVLSFVLSKAEIVKGV